MSIKDRLLAIKTNTRSVKTALTLSVQWDGMGWDERDVDEGAEKQEQNSTPCLNSGCNAMVGKAKSAVSCVKPEHIKLSFGCFFIPPLAVESRQSTPSRRLWTWAFGDLFDLITRDRNVTRRDGGKWHELAAHFLGRFFPRRVMLRHALDERKEQFAQAGWRFVLRSFEKGPLELAVSITSSSKLASICSLSTVAKQTKRTTQGRSSPRFQS